MKEETTIIKYDNTIVVNLFAGPGAGKSTMAADIFSKLKWAGVDCEILMEYAKGLQWEGSLNKMQDQIYIFGKQLHGLNILKNKVEVIVTDSPILLSIVYGKRRGMSKTFEDLVIEEWNKLDGMNYYVVRKKEYNPNGRSQTHEQAVELDNEVSGILNQIGVKFKTVTGELETVSKIVNEILNRLGKPVNTVSGINVGSQNANKIINIQGDYNE